MIKFKINKNDSEIKAEKFLLKATTAPASLIYKAFRKKDVKINGRWIKEGYILCEGDELCIYISDEFLRTKRLSSAPPQISVVYEDENIIVMNKPAGLASQPDVKGADALSERLLAYLTERGEFDPRRESSFAPALCNRLDTNTSGLVIGAKNALALREMNSAIKNRLVKKYYICETQGVPFPKTATLSTTLKKDSARNISRVGEGGKEASLTYRVLGESDGNAMVEVELHTGRSHQIRAQMAAIGCPIVGDTKYGAKQGGGQRLSAYRLIFNISSGALAYLYAKSIEIEIGWD